MLGGPLQDAGDRAVTRLLGHRALDVLGLPTFPVRRDHEAAGHLVRRVGAQAGAHEMEAGIEARGGPGRGDRKSTRLNSSHVAISYAVFCLKKKRTRNS